MTSQSELASVQNHGESSKLSADSQSHDQDSQSDEEENHSPDEFNQLNETSSSSPKNAEPSPQEELAASQGPREPMNSKRKRFRMQRSLDSDSEYR